MVATQHALATHAEPAYPGPVTLLLTADEAAKPELISDWRRVAPALEVVTLPGAHDQRAPLPSAHPGAGPDPRRTSAASDDDMKKALRWFLYVVGALVLLVVLVRVGFAVAFWNKPELRPAPTLTIERTPERVERGRYVVENLAACYRCHAAPDRSLYGFPPVKGTEGVGECWNKPPDGWACASNLTPDPEFGLGKWTDGEILRALREGVSRDGRTLWTMMPYQQYHAMADADAEAVVAFLRTLKPVAEERRWD